MSIMDGRDLRVRDELTAVIVAIVVIVGGILIALFIATPISAITTVIVVVVVIGVTGVVIVIIVVVGPNKTARVVTVARQDAKRPPARLANPSGIILSKALSIAICDGTS